MSSSPPRPSRPLTDFGLLPGERPTVPQADVADSDDAWAEFERLAAGMAPADTAPQGVASPAPADLAYAPTEPAPLARPAAPATPRPAVPAGVTLEQAVAECRRLNRVCPRPEHWQRLYDMLPNKVTTGRHVHPSPPLSEGAWRATSALPKRLCLRDHLEWADAQGVLDEVMAFLRQLREEDWHHLDD